MNMNNTLQIKNKMGSWNKHSYKAYVGPHTGDHSDHSTQRGVPQQSDVSHWGCNKWETSKRSYRIFFFHYLFSFNFPVWIVPVNVKYINQKLVMFSPIFLNHPLPSNLSLHIFRHKSWSSRGKIKMRLSGQGVMVYSFVNSSVFYLTAWPHSHSAVKESVWEHFF